MALSLNSIEEMASHASNLRAAGAGHVSKYVANMGGDPLSAAIQERLFSIGQNHLQRNGISPDTLEKAEAGRSTIR